VTAGSSRWLALTGLAALMALLLWPPDAPRLIGAAPLAGLMLAGLLAVPNWQVVTAILMLPYFSFGIMEMIVNAAGRPRAVTFAALAVAVFLAAMDALRRSRAGR